MGHAVLKPFHPPVYRSRPTIIMHLPRIDNRFCQIRHHTRRVLTSLTHMTSAQSSPPQSEPEDPASSIFQPIIPHASNR
jgi:hypothetical protein